jgi:hypothetical protein
VGGATISQEGRDSQALVGQRQILLTRLQRRRELPGNLLAGVAVQHLPPAAIQGDRGAPLAVRFALVD